MTSSMLGNTFRPCLLSILWLTAMPVLGEDYPLTSTTSVRFASLEEGQKLLASRDEFALTLSRFDRQVRMQTAEDVSLDDWLAFNAGHTRQWNEAEMQRVTAALDDLRPRLARYELQLPKTILLVRTTGKEEGDAAYTRQAAIMLPDKVLAYPKEQLESLLIHELFHVVSRHDPALRQKLYAIIGFVPCDGIKLPAAWDERGSQSGCPQDRLLHRVEGRGTGNGGAPFLLRRRRESDPQAGGSCSSTCRSSCSC
jgi:hypothetical protein